MWGRSFDRVAVRLQLAVVAKGNRPMLAAGSATRFFSNEAAERGGKWNIRADEKVLAHKDPVGDLLASINHGTKQGTVGNPALPMISLTATDATKCPGIGPSDTMVDTLCDAFATGKGASYQPSQGSFPAREAIAKFMSVPNRPPLKASDIFMTFGSTDSMMIALSTLVLKDHNVLAPQVRRPQYDQFVQLFNAEVRSYPLVEAKGWSVDVPALEKLADEKTCGILVLNPSEQCSTVFSQEHLEEVLDAAERLRLPVIAGETYQDMSFGRPFVRAAAANAKVPVVSISAFSERWFAPGWRLGWIAIYDVDDAFKRAQVPQALMNFCQLMLGPSGPVQAAVPPILACDKEDHWLEQALQVIQKHAKLCTESVKATPCLTVLSEPQGPPYLLVRIETEKLKGLEDGIVFASKLLEEESVSVLPGEYFGCPKHFRVAMAAVDYETLTTAWKRIISFCERHEVR